METLGTTIGSEKQDLDQELTNQARYFETLLRLALNFFHKININDISLEKTSVQDYAYFLEYLVIARQIAIGNIPFIQMNRYNESQQKLIVATVLRVQEMLHNLLGDDYEASYFITENELENLTAEQKLLKFSQYLPASNDSRQLLEQYIESLDHPELVENLDTVTLLAKSSQELRKDNSEAIEQLRKEIIATGKSAELVDVIIQKTRDMIAVTNILSTENVLDLVSEALQKNGVPVKADGASGTGVNLILPKEFKLEMDPDIRKQLTSLVIDLFKNQMNENSSEKLQEIYIQIQQILNANGLFDLYDDKQIGDKSGEKFVNYSFLYEALQQAVESNDKQLALYIIYKGFEKSGRYANYQEFIKDVNNEKVIIQEFIAGGNEGSLNFARITHSQNKNLGQAIESNYIAVIGSQQYVPGGSHAGNLSENISMDQEMTLINMAVEFHLKLICRLAGIPDTDLEKLPYFGVDYLYTLRDANAQDEFLNRNFKITEINPRETGLAMFMKMFLKIVLLAQPEFKDHQFFGYKIPVSHNSDDILDSSVVTKVMVKVETFNQKSAKLACVPSCLLPYPQEGHDSTQMIAIFVLKNKDETMSIPEILKEINSFNFEIDRITNESPANI